MQESKMRRAATKRYSEDVVTIISENFNYIIGVCSLTRNDLINSNSPKKCMSGGSFDKLKAYKDKAGNNYDPGWVPQDQTIINFVSMINRFLALILNQLIYKIQIYQICLVSFLKMLHFNLNGIVGFITVIF